MCVYDWHQEHVRCSSLPLARAASCSRTPSLTVPESGAFRLLVRLTAERLLRLLSVVALPMRPAPSRAALVPHSSLPMSIVHRSPEGWPVALAYDRFHLKLCR